MQWVSMMFLTDVNCFSLCNIDKRFSSSYRYWFGKSFCRMLSSYNHCIILHPGLLSSSKTLTMKCESTLGPSGSLMYKYFIERPFVSYHHLCDLKGPLVCLFVSMLYYAPSKLVQSKMPQMLTCTRLQHGEFFIVPKRPRSSKRYISEQKKPIQTKQINMTLIISSGI